MADEALPVFGGMTTNEKLELIKAGKLTKDMLTADDVAHIIAASTAAASKPIEVAGTIVAGAGGWVPTAGQLAGITLGCGIGATVGGILVAIPGPTQIVGAIVLGLASIVGAFFGINSAGPRAPVAAPVPNVPAAPGKQ